MEKKQPVVGITARRGDTTWVTENTRNYIAVLQSYGIETVILAPDTSATLADGTHFEPDGQGRLPDAVLDRLDGLLLAGGGDVAPHHFGASLDGAEPESIDLRRDELELALCRGAWARNLPVLGICRGCQVMNVAAGGGMVQHFDGHRSPKDGPAYHTVRIAADSRLHAILHTDELPVNTYHHQGVDRATLAPLFDAAGLAEPDGWLVEAFESRRHRWVFGVQWHPERLFELTESHRRLWDSFVDACRSEAIGEEHPAAANWNAAD